MKTFGLRRFLPLLLTLVCGGAILFAGHSWNQITSPRVVAHATMPNGVEIMIKQTFDWELFDTSFYHRSPGGNWVWRYYSHEDGTGGMDASNLMSRRKSPLCAAMGRRRLNLTGAISRTRGSLTLKVGSQGRSLGRRQLTPGSFAK